MIAIAIVAFLTGANLGLWYLLHEQSKLTDECLKEVRRCTDALENAHATIKRMNEK